MSQQSNTVNWQPDASQQAVIDAQEGFHLVLAPPGCGKTQILTERIRRAHLSGIAYEDMLCMTFTNRAARGMRSRIGEMIDDPDIDKLYVGNIHRFCSKFLFDNGIVPGETSIIDDDDSVSILARYLDEDEDRVKTNNNRRHAYNTVIALSSLMYQIEHQHPRELRIHNDCLTASDIQAMKYIAQVEKQPFNREKMIDIYHHNDYYADATRMDGYSMGMQPSIRELLTKMKYAHAYTAYKKQNKLLDFPDLLLLTYDALTERKEPLCRWMQVDEVQDLNPLQLAILDLLVGYKEGQKGAEAPSVMYLGDEQQAIFSFMGAKLSTLEMLKERCAPNIHHLDINHRSPSYLLDVFNTYAQRQLGISPELLPQASVRQDARGNERLIISSPTIEKEYADAARIVDNLRKEWPQETSAVIVNSNKDADRVSEQLTQMGTPHFKVSGTDLFSSPEVKMLLAHFAVSNNDNSFIPWSRILQGTKVFQTAASARSYVHQLLVRAIVPSDFLRYDYGDTYVQDFARHYAEEEIVVFDTETTGLNVFEDDILQIAAVKVRQGKVVDDSQFSVYIETDRPIPAMLGDIVNPIVEERKQQTLLRHDEALKMFLDYAGDDVLLGHNADYDYRIMDYNLRRYLPQVNWQEMHPKYFDSLLLTRLLEPDLRSYKLKHLLEVLHLEGENSHLADADVNATVSVMTHCYKKAQDIIPSQREFLGREVVKGRFSVFRKNYSELYFHTQQQLYVRHRDGSVALTDEMNWVRKTMNEMGFMRPIEKFDYIEAYLTHDLLHPETELSLKEQLDAHLMEICTLKEADLCGGSSIKDNVFVTTVHKAKGLEFDNVIVFDAVDGRYPNYYYRDDRNKVMEDARKFFVAMSRAKKRLFVMTSEYVMTYQRGPIPHSITPFMECIMPFFNQKSSH
jgi:DNA helicase-2/ATP-dependent DNA helicase PcrA